MTNATFHQEANLAERYRALWEGDAHPNLEAFVAQRLPLTAAALGVLVRVDQRERAARGQIVPTEDYFARFPATQQDDETALDLIYNEFLLREQASEAPLVDEFLQRFARFALPLTSQIELHQMLDEEQASGDEKRPGTTPNARHDVSADRELGVADVVQGGGGTFRIERVLGSGGMGVVYLRRDLSLDRLVALKLPRLADPFDHVGLRRFEREALAIARLKHPNICGVYATGVIDDKPYLALEFIDGESLDSLLHCAGSLPQRQAVYLALKTAAAIQTAHDAGVLHRDLKPGNILIDIRGEPIVMDFGLALITESNGSSITARGSFVGTPAYCSPEQLLGDRDAVSAASDVYALGVVLFQMLTGRQAFEGVMSEVIDQVVAAQRPRVASWRQDVLPKLDTVFAKAMARSPNQRYASMRDFAAALEDLQTQLPVDKEAWVRPATHVVSPETLLPGGETLLQTMERTPARGGRARFRVRLAAVMAIGTLAAAWAVMAWWKEYGHVNHLDSQQTDPIPQESAR